MNKYFRKVFSFLNVWAFSCTGWTFLYSPATSAIWWGTIFESWGFYHFFVDGSSNRSKHAFAILYTYILTYLLTLSTRCVLDKETKIPNPNNELFLDNLTSEIHIGIESEMKKKIQYNYSFTKYYLSKSFTWYCLL